MDMLFATNISDFKETNPRASFHLYKTVILQIVLYGCEVWSKLKSTDISTLDKFQHFIVKYILFSIFFTRLFVFRGLQKKSLWVYTRCF